MAEVPNESQPQSTVERFNALADALPPEPEAPEAEAVAAAPEAPPFDPATYKIPSSAVPNVPKAFEKFKDKTLSDVFTSYENAEQQMHAKSAEAAQTRRENEELKTRLAVAEQFARMSPQPAAASTDQWQRAGVNPDEQAFTQPRLLADTTISIANQNARAVAREEANTAAQQIRNELAARDQATALFQTFEAARSDLASQGYSMTQEEWKNALEYVAGPVMRENQAFNPKRYVERFIAFKGPAAKPVIPAEGSPPVATRPAAVNQDTGAPTLTREEKQLNKRIRAALGLES